jgi:hypothetical protein
METNFGPVPAFRGPQRGYRPESPNGRGPDRAAAAGSATRWKGKDRPYRIKSSLRCTDLSAITPLR